MSLATELPPASEFIARTLRDPVGFIEDTFRCKVVLPKTRELIEAVRDHHRVYCRACFDSTKTWTVARLALWWLICHPQDAIVVTTAPIWKQVEELIWREIASAYGRSKVPFGGKLLKTKLDLGPKWYAIGLSTKNEWNLSGYHATAVLVIIDEADGVPKEKWDALEGLITSATCKLVAIGNPLDIQSEFARRSREEKDRPGTYVMKIEAEDVLPYGDQYPFLLQRSWVEDKKFRWGESSALYIGKVLAEWPEQGIDVVIPISWLLRAKDREVPRGERTYGADIARFGTNKTVRTLMEGGWFAWARGTSQEDTMQTAGRIVRDLEDYDPLACAIDDSGVGGGVVDRVRQLAPHRGIVAVNNGSKPDDGVRFLNKGSELWWRTRKGFEDATIGLSMADPEVVDELIADLNRPRYTTDAQARIVVNKMGLRPGQSEVSLSEEERARRSPDYGDSFVLAYNAARPYLAKIAERRDRAELMQPNRTRDGLMGTARGARRMWDGSRYGRH